MSLVSRVIVMPSGLTRFRTNGIYSADGTNPSAGTIQDSGPGVSVDSQDGTGGKDISPANPGLKPPPMGTLPDAPAPSSSPMFAGMDLTTILIIAGAGFGLWYFSQKG
jgi:hypothetical protein